MQQNKHTVIWRIINMFGQGYSVFWSQNKIFGPWNRKSKNIYRKSTKMAWTDLDRQWLHLTVEHDWCAGRRSVTPQIAGGQTSAASKQCSAYWTLSDFPWLIFWASLMTSGGQQRAESSDRGPHSPQEAVDFRDPRKTPKQACRRVCKQENTQRKAPGSSARCLQGPRDTLRLRVLLPILTHNVSLFSDVLCACHWLYPSLCEFVYSKYLKLGSLFVGWNFLDEI